LSDDKLDISINIVPEVLSYPVKRVIDGACSFIGKICTPAAEEAGLLLYAVLHQLDQKII
jgi:hypothetical protein